MTITLKSNPDGVSGAIQVNGVDRLTVNSSGAVTASNNPATGLRSTALATMQKFADEFGSSLAANGYQKLPSGLIIQWGNVGTAAEPSAVTFPIAYPTSCASVTVTANRSADPGGSITYGVNKSTTGFSVIRMDAGAAQVEPFFWMSIGY